VTDPYILIGLLVAVLIMTAWAFWRHVRSRREDGIYFTHGRKRHGDRRR
jgi:hypothetical protein